MCTVWGMVTAVTGEPSFEQMSSQDRHQLQRLGARLAFEDPIHRHNLNTWEDLAGKTDVSGKMSRESQYFHDIEFTATARWARRMQLEFPALQEPMSRIINNCFDALLTQESRLQFHKAVNEFALARLGGPARLAVDNGDKPADPDGKRSAMKPVEPQKLAI